MEAWELLQWETPRLCLPILPNAYSTANVQAIERFIRPRIRPRKSFQRKAFVDVVQMHPVKPAL